MKSNYFSRQLDQLLSRLCNFVLMRVQIFTAVLQKEDSDLIHANNMFSMTLSGGEYARHLHLDNGYGSIMVGNIIPLSFKNDEY
jgi:hypothetical protein